MKINMTLDGGIDGIGIGDGFSPTSLTGLSGWYDSGDISTITKNGSNKVSQWNDKSSRGLNAIQATSANQFTYSATAYSGLPGMLTGSPTSMTAGTNANWEFLHDGTGCTVFIDAVITPSQTNNFTCLLSTYDGAGADIGAAFVFENFTATAGEFWTYVGASSGNILTSKTGVNTVNQLQNIILQSSTQSGQTPTNCAQYIANVYQTATGGNFS